MRPDDSGPRPTRDQLGIYELAPGEVDLIVMLLNNAACVGLTREETWTAERLSRMFDVAPTVVVATRRTLQHV